MKRSEVIKEVTLRSGLTQVQSKEVLKIVTDIVTRELSIGNKVNIDGLGCFYAVPYREHTIKNFNGTLQTVEARLSPRFKPSKNLKEAIKGKKADNKKM